jgi:hypothetical protein
MKYLTKFACVSFILFVKLYYSQIKLNITAEKSEKFPKNLHNFYQDYSAVEPYGYIFNIKIENISNNTISIPVDTVSYALPYTDNFSQFEKDKITSNDFVDFNMLSIYAFVYQNGSFLSSSLYDDPQYENEQLLEKRQVKDFFKNKIENWKIKKKLKSYSTTMYNWYILKNMITIPPKGYISYKIYFNPLLKTNEKYSFKEFYYNFNKKLSYDVEFRIIVPKKIYKFLTLEDRKKYLNLFSGLSNSIRIKLPN